ncbi:MAG: AI-2E family transporter, partial [Methylococcaceae bacterium]|nr:AI-2E family transporter [Methylococcaceae bacterium]
EKLCATIYSVFALALLIAPTVVISASFIETSKHLVNGLAHNTLSVPPPNSNVRDWPLVGERVYGIWNQASVNLKGTLKEYAPHIRPISGTLLSAAAGAGSGILQFIIAIIISGVLLAKSNACYRFTLKFFQRLSGENNGLLFTNLARSTIRSVAQGVLGIAIIQSVLMAIGFYWIEIPGWGLWTVLILVFAVAQLPLLLVLAPIIAYVFSVSETTPAIVFTIWSLIVGISDGFLKPLLLGRGMRTPSLVILLGAIGGMLLSGILGLFVGAVVLALGYELFMAWLNRDTSEETHETG